MPTCPPGSGIHAEPRPRAPPLPSALWAPVSCIACHGISVYLQHIYWLLRSTRNWPYQQMAPFQPFLTNFFAALARYRFHLIHILQFRFAP
jgi:hypothetical protein